MADCYLCDTDHQRGSPDCPKSRVGSIVASKYQVISMLGMGGMGAVYEVMHLALRKPVALKMLLPKAQADQEIALRFFREAREAAALGHPGIIDVRDVGQAADGCPFMEMELLEGRTVADLIGTGPVDVDRAVRIATEALDALATAQENGIVHRDIKPANLFLARRPEGGERVVVLDFGVAKARDDLGLTNTGMKLGTPAYMSPEQCDDAKHVDVRTDVYAMGATLFELLTGKLTIEGDKVSTFYRNILAGNVARHPRALRPEVPEWLDEVVARSLALRREDRFPGAQAMRRALMAQALPRTAPAPQVVGKPTLEAIDNVRFAPTLPVSGATAAALEAPATPHAEHSAPAVLAPDEKRARRRPLLLIAAIVTAIGLAAGGAAILGMHFFG